MRNRFDCVWARFQRVLRPLTALPADFGLAFVAGRRVLSRRKKPVVGVVGVGSVVARAYITPASKTKVHTPLYTF